MKNSPLIGVSGSIEHDESKQMILRDYMTALLAAGGIPLLLSLDMEQEHLEALLPRLDGVMLAGGYDVAPGLYHTLPQAGLGQVDPLRDGFELRLTRACHSRGMPLLGVCRGIQIMNVALGGTLYQDLPSQYSQETQRELILHSQREPGKYPSHLVRLGRKSRLFEILGEESLSVNSFHHQAVREPAPGFQVCAQAPDGVIEAVEDEAHPFFVGVQWHPERLYRSDPPSLALFTALIQAAAAYAKEAGKEEAP